MTREADGSSSARSEFRERLFRRTISLANDRIPGYRELWCGLDNDVKGLIDLAKLPIVRKERMMAEPELFRDQAVRTEIVQHTTGTTGKPLLIHRGKAELKFIQDFFGSIIKPDANAPQSPVRISVGESFHGSPVLVPYPGQVFSIDPRDAYWDRDLLVTDPGFVLGGSDSRVAVVSGIESQVRILTCQLIEAGYDFSRSKVAGLITTGEIITRRLRSWYEQTWRVPLVDIYSMTEMIGGAKVCGICGFRHLDPQIIGEVVDPFTEQQVHAGYGVLVLTCLAPFIQKQPFIRYWTGDFVKIGPPCSSGELGFELKGRLSLCVVEETTDGVRPLICAAEIYDLLDNYPDLARGRMFTSTPGISDHSALGHLKFRVDASQDRDVLTIQITMQTNYIHYLYAERLTDLATAIKQQLAALQPRLKERIAADTVRLEVKAVSRGQILSFFPDWVE